MNNICKCPFPYCDDISLIQFNNLNQISYNCLRNHKITKEINDLLINNISDKEKNNIYDFCKIHKKNYFYFCESCRINFCNFCKEKHNKHKFFPIIEKIPSKNIYNRLDIFINKQKKELENIKKLFNELIQKGKEEFDKIFNILYKYILCEESMIKFSINNINHMISIENIKYILNINLKENISNLYKIKFNIEELNSKIDKSPIFEKIDKVFKYIENIYYKSNEKINKEKIDKNNFNIYYTNIFKDKKKNRDNVLKNEYDEMQEKIKKLKFEFNLHKILNEHEGEIRNIISLNNGFFISSSLDGTLKIFNSLTGECFLSMNEPYNDQICQIIKIQPNKEDNKIDKTYILLLSRHLIFIRLNNDIFYNHENLDVNDDNIYLEILQNIDNNGIYISQGIQLTNSDIVTYNDDNKLKIYKLNPQTKTYLLHKFNINLNLIEFCSLLEIKPNIFVASSNEHLDNGENILKIFDLNENDINKKLNKEIVIKNINCSTGRDSLCMIQKNKILAVGLQNFNDKDNSKKNINFVDGIAIVDVNFYQVIQIIEDFRVHSVCKINFYVNYFLMNKDDIFKKEMCFTKRKILAAAGYDQENEKRLIKFYEILSEDNIYDNNKYINIIKRSEIISEHEGFINSTKWLDNGLLATCSSDRMIFLYKYSDLDI